MVSSCLLKAERVEISRLLANERFRFPAFAGVGTSAASVCPLMWLDTVQDTFCCAIEAISRSPACILDYRGRLNAVAQDTLRVSAHS